ncbi:hypothetical protein [Modestobacter sp. Leaf380]|uniref:hypothetical protein n=1 Tax=Modestobacter sp. Leaf380 TaxID=1736356 RepID=UPI0006F6EB99|nr:hypothetical protein [Modestobacter sp. Leaf380]KQS66299.1 hypothetical protein ASG41_13395 [Modestobacter sp. Leaf380]
MSEHDTLPLPDHDHLPLGSLTSRIRTLDAGGLGQVLAYERAHADRLPVVQAVEHRLEQLRSGAEPSEGSPLAAQPEHAPPAAGGSQVGEATAGPVVDPPSHGDPTNPAQPRSTG